MRARISLPLLLPILGLLAPSGPSFMQKLAVVAAMQRVDTVSELVTDTSALAHEVQRERGLSGGFLASKGTGQADDLIVSESVPIPALPPSMRGSGTSTSITL